MDGGHDNLYGAIELFFLLKMPHLILLRCSFVVFQSLLVLLLKLLESEELTHEKKREELEICHSTDQFAQILQFCLRGFCFCQLKRGGIHLTLQRVILTLKLFV